MTSEYSLRNTEFYHTLGFNTFFFLFFVELILAVNHMHHFVQSCFQLKFSSVKKLTKFEICFTSSCGTWTSFIVVIFFWFSFPFFTLSASIGSASAWLNCLLEQLRLVLSLIGAEGPCLCWERKPLLEAQCKNEPVLPAFSITPQKNHKKSCKV